MLSQILSPLAQMSQKASHPEYKLKVYLQALQDWPQRLSELSFDCSPPRCPPQPQNYTAVRPCRHYFPISGLCPSDRETLIPTWLAVNISSLLGLLWTSPGIFRHPEGLEEFSLQRKQKDGKAIFTIFWKHYVKMPLISFNSESSLISWRRQWLPTPGLSPGKSHGWRSLVGCSPGGRRTELDTTAAT